MTKKVVSTIPTEVAHKESEQERENEVIQQNDINKEIEDIKNGVEDVKEYVRDELMKKKMMRLIAQLPAEDRLRNLVDEDREDVNVNKAKSKIEISK